MMNLFFGGVMMFSAAVLDSAPANATTTPAYPALFGTKEVHSKNLAPFAKWNGVLERYFDEVELADGDCQATSFNKCYLQDWAAFLDTLRGGDPMEQLDRVNRYMNAARYITDPRNWNTKDYWATPGQFFNRDGDWLDSGELVYSGDVSEGFNRITISVPFDASIGASYAIAKFMSLRALGWDNAHLRIVLLQDLNLKIPHAVLVVYRDDGTWVLDNQIEQLITADKILHYRPLFSLNEDSWWLHRR